MIREFPPLMESALRALRRGPLELTATGWVSIAGVDGTWNSHTLEYLRLRRWAHIYISGEKRQARIRSLGRQALERMDFAA